MVDGTGMMTSHFQMEKLKLLTVNLLRSDPKEAEESD